MSVNSMPSNALHERETSVNVRIQRVRCGCCLLQVREGDRSLTNAAQAFSALRRAFGWRGDEIRSPLGSGMEDESTEAEVVLVDNRRLRVSEQVREPTSSDS